MMTANTHSFLIAFLWAFAIVFSSLGQTPQEYRFGVVDVQKGLTHKEVNCFLKDSRGYVWIGTGGGLNRFDGQKLKVFRHDPKDSTSVHDNNVYKLFEDPEGNIWVGSGTEYSLYDPATESFNRNWQAQLQKFSVQDSILDEIIKVQDHNFWFIQPEKGISRYNSKSGKTFTLKHNPNIPGSIGSNSISAMAQNAEGDFWLLHRNGILEKLDGESLRVVYQNDHFHKNFKGHSHNYRLTIDSDGDLWIYLTSGPMGIYLYQADNNEVRHIHKRSAIAALNSDLVKGVVEEEAGKIWVGTDLGGVNIINKNDFSVQYVLQSPEISNSLVHNSIYSLYKDYDGVIWLGAFKNGVNYYHKNLIRFQYFRNYASLAESLPYDDVNCFEEDEKGNLWIGTNGGGLIYFNVHSGKFTQYRNDPEKPNTLSSDVIVSLEIDQHENLWIGTYLGGLNKFDGKNFTHYRHNPADSGSISDDSIWEVFEDSNGNLWVGGVSGGLDVLEAGKGLFRHIRREYDEYSVINLHISSITEDVKGRIWIGGNDGIDVLDPESGKVMHFQQDSEKPGNLLGNSIFWILKDSRDNMWAGTQDGLALYQEKENSFRYFREEDGLPHNSVLTFLEDDQNNYWLSTPNGVSQMLTDTLNGRLSVSFNHYDERDGLQGRIFNENAAFKTSKGELLFGGPKGFNMIRPGQLEEPPGSPAIAFTDFQLFNQSVEIGRPINGRILLPNSLSETDEITLEHNENVFSLEFTALSFFQPEKIRYKYMLKGFDQKWHTAGHLERKVTYTNLDPGSYTFTVLASAKNGQWMEQGKSIHIEVLAPLWRTKKAYAFYALFIIGCLYAGRRVMLQRERMKFRIEQERREARQLHELDLMKIRFFTNVSHEFRTPLALILAPLEKLLSLAEEQEYQKQFSMIHRNAKRLLNLVNQLLDFRKIEVEGINFYPSEGNVIKFLEESVRSFSDLSEKKNIELSFRTNTKELQASFDMDKLEKILFNLLSNAFKFTPENGKIGVEVNCHQNDSFSEGLKILEIKVRDTGIGIPKDKQEKVFERFFRNDVPDSLVNQGSGIGLSITREFVKIHGGTITLESQPGMGSCFTVNIPVKEVATGAPAYEAAEKELVLLPALDPVKEHALPAKGKKPLVLLIEDHEDFRFYLKDNLSVHFTIIEARNGKEGWQKALANIPELIVSDLMMPEMNGISLCRKIKEDSRTSHIPFVLLTAHTAEEHKLKGLNIGANDYITKPFNFEILLSRINNLIRQRNLLQKNFEKKISITPAEVEIHSQEDKLIRNAAGIVEENLADPDFSVEMLSKELGMSRASLYKKLLTITGRSPVEFIRKIRLQRAAQYLEKDQLTVAEVAYKVGFNNARYFSKYFKEEFNVLPSHYPEKKEVKNN